MVPRATSFSAKDCWARASEAESARSKSLPLRPRFASRGWGRAASIANSRYPIGERSAQAMVSGAEVASQIPAGFTYLGQFVDHDLTFDKTNVMLGENVSPAELLQARSPSLDLDSLYGAGPTDPDVGQVLRGRRHPPEDGEDGRDRRHPGEAGLRPSARRGIDGAEKRKAIIPDPAKRREPRGRPDAPGLHPLPQPRRRHAPGSCASRAALRKSPGEGHQALPVDAPHRLPASHLRARRRQRGLQQRAEGVRGGSCRRRTSRRCPSSSRWPPSASGTR